jgi:hypothetical protein
MPSGHSFDANHVILPTRLAGQKVASPQIFEPSGDREGSKKYTYILRS